ncbi:MAG TPA: hypothetical protein VJU54_09110 [Nitrospiraceae bacterium]|nr:hypothetical protein [Nitrospiraceae bacterium]
MSDEGVLLMTFLLIALVVGYGTLFGALVLWIGRVREDVKESPTGRYAPVRPLRKAA